jgi:hypothetical protein
MLMKGKDLKKFIDILPFKIILEGEKMNFKDLECNMKDILPHINKSHEINHYAWKNDN